MGNCKLTRLMLQKIKEGRFQTIAEIKASTTVAKPSSSSSFFKNITCSKCGLGASQLEESSRTKLVAGDDDVSIYKVPTQLRQLETKAYSPNIISIGPYHHGVPRLQAMEAIKWQFFNGLFDPNQQNASTLKEVYEAMEEYEEEARSCYSEKIGICKEKFVEIMVVDGCFILQLFRQLNNKPDSSKYEPPDFIKRWMMPFLRRDLIMLENQLPLAVLEKLFDLTKSNTSTPPTNLSLGELAIRFFEPLIQPRGVEIALLNQSINPPDINRENYSSSRHLLDLFRSSVLPTVEKRRKEPHIFRSAAELKEAYIKIKKRENCKPMELNFKGKVLEIPPLYIDDYRGTLYRNLVAFEQCYRNHKPDITRYLFFLDALINSAKDVELLHYAGVVQHRLGNNKEVARLVNKLCKEVAPDIEESYLYEVVEGIHRHCNKVRYRCLAFLVHNYFCNIWVGMTTVFSVILIYLTLVQTCCEVADGQKFHDHGFWSSLGKSFHAPLLFLTKGRRSVDESEENIEMFWHKHRDVLAQIFHVIRLNRLSKMPLARLES